MPDTARPARPLVPARCPVAILHACASNDTAGNPRRCYVVRTLGGALVEVLDEGYHGSGEVDTRYPWGSWHRLRALGFDEPARHTVYPQRVNVPPAEYRRLLKLEPDAADPDVVAVLALADRNARREQRRQAARRAAERTTAGASA